MINRLKQNPKADISGFKAYYAGQSLIWAQAKQTGKYEKQLRYLGEDSVYEKDKMNTLGYNLLQ